MWMSAQETNWWQVVKVHITACHTLGLWSSIYTLLQEWTKNQMKRTKWMSVGNPWVTCGLSNNVTHHLCFDRSKGCWFIRHLGHCQFVCVSAFCGTENKKHNQMQRIKWMSVGNSLVACDLNKILHTTFGKRRRLVTDWYDSTGGRTTLRHFCSLRLLYLFTLHLPLLLLSLLGRTILLPFF